MSEQSPAIITSYVSEMLETHLSPSGLMHYTLTIRCRAGTAPSIGAVIEAPKECHAPPGLRLVVTSIHLDVGFDGLGCTEFPDEIARHVLATVRAVGTALAARVT